MESNNILYHGSTIVVEEPLTNIGRPELDFGQGFYLTNNYEQAEKWAITKSSRKRNAKAIINVYQFDFDCFMSCNYLKRIFSQYNKEWLDFIADSRRGKSPWDKYDWIEGGIANDSVITTVDAYVDGFITAEQAIDQLVKQDLKHQVCIRNQEIISKFLHFRESIEK